MKFRQYNVMGEMRIGSADYTDMTNTVGSITIETKDQDAPGSSYTCDWAKWNGYYVKIPELAAAIDKKAMWTVGKGFEASADVKKELNAIHGCGKDSFNSILYNAVRTYTMGGDSYAEIIRDGNALVNLKPLNPGSISILSNSRGIIIGYEQNVAATGKKIALSADRVFHMPYNRLADECHGISTIAKLEDIVQSRNEAFEDLRMVFHRYVKPLLLIEADTDDPAKIAELKAKADNSVKYGENMVVPKDSVSITRSSIPQYSTLDPMPWINVLTRYFLIAEGCPEVILGYGKDTTEASSKILYLAWQQVVEHNQLFLEEQIKAQLGIDIELNFPADIAPEVQTDVRKERDINNQGDGENVKRQGYLGKLRDRILG
jgi:hypothetical protein